MLCDWKTLQSANSLSDQCGRLIGGKIDHLALRLERQRCAQSSPTERSARKNGIGLVQGDCVSGAVCEISARNLLMLPEITDSTDYRLIFGRSK